MIMKGLARCTLFVSVTFGVYFPAIAGDQPPEEQSSGIRAASPSKNSLTADSMSPLHKLIRLQPGEFKWDQIPWYASIWHARQAAAAEDKPIFVFGTGGAGFNDPLGNC